jgi:dihydroxyacid dehydratase/phosphogluconate dehydratase
MPDRELIAESIEFPLTAHAVGAMLLLTPCNQVTPGMRLAAARG